MKPMPKKKEPQCIVVWDCDEICVPMGWDSDCEGAITAYVDEVAVFQNRIEALRAIRITKKYQLLRAAQGKQTNDDFLCSSTYIRILPLAEIPNET